MKLHHIAYVTDDVRSRAAAWREVFGWRQRGEMVTDERQGVKILMVDAGGTLIELLEPMGKDSPIRNFLQRGGGIYHPCFEVEDLDSCLAALRKRGAACIARPPTPAAAFDGRRVAFVVTATKDVIEFIEAKRPIPQERTL